MKKLLTTLALTTALSFSANADDAVDLCVSYSDAAEIIMTKRQNNASMADLYKLADGEQAIIVLMKEAYKVPLYSSAEYKSNAIDEFKNDIFMLCIQTYGEKRQMD